MNTTFRGGDIQAMQDLEGRLDRYAKQVEQSVADVTRQINGVDWFGKDAEQFKGQTISRIRTDLVEAGKILASTKTKLAGNIADQIDVSNVL